jgi:hypothetical protein
MGAENRLPERQTDQQMADRMRGRQTGSVAERLTGNMEGRH